MNYYEIRRIKMDDSPMRGDICWVLFERGNIARPVLLLQDSQLDYLLDEIDRQRETVKKGARKGAP